MNLDSVVTNPECMIFLLPVSSGSPMFKLRASRLFITCVNTYKVAKEIVHEPQIQNFSFAVVRYWVVAVLVSCVH